MEQEDRIPPEVDVNLPSIARVYGYYLGGSHNFRADREAAEHTLTVYPQLRPMLYENRAFLRRAVGYCVDNGITQFLDIGSGIPTVGNVHEIAQRADTNARVVYVDIDPIAVVHSRAILAGNGTVTAIRADVRAPDRILENPEVRRLLDLRRPVALFMLAVLHFVADTEDPHRLVRRYRDALAPGSYLAITHGTTDHTEMKAGVESWKATYDRTVARTTARSKAEIAEFFTGFELVEPGLVWTSRWRPEPDAQPPGVPENYGALGRKP